MDDTNALFNKQIEEQLQKIKKNIEKKLELEKKQILEKIKERKIFYDKLGKKRNIPNIKLRGLPSGMNSLINPILFCLANLDIIAEFILSDKKQEILDKFPDNNNFIRNFNDLMVDIRDNNILSPNFDNMHKYLQTEMKETYKSQVPKYIINSFLSALDKEINLAKVDNGNKFSNLIQDYFSFTLITTKNCIQDNVSIKLKEEKKYIIDLFLRESVLSSAVEFGDNFRDFLLPQDANDNFKEVCPKCKKKMNLGKSVENLKKYLIININREKESKDLIKFKYSSLKLKGGDNKYYNFKLILALCDINTNTENIEQNELIKINEKNGTNFKIFFKNLINNQWYADTEIFKKNIEKKLNDECKPNILIYKRDQINLS